MQREVTEPLYLDLAIPAGAGFAQALPAPHNAFVTDSGVFAISGGVVLGNPTFVPSFPAQGSPPNLHGTLTSLTPACFPRLILPCRAPRGRRPLAGCCSMVSLFQKRTTRTSSRG